MNPVSSDSPTNTSRQPKTIASARLDAYACRSAPSNPPAALVIPNQRKMRRSTWPRRSQNRTAVPKTCGIETAATATFVPRRTASRGVSTLPIPNPATDATPPATTAAMPTAIANIITVGRARPGREDIPSARVSDRLREVPSAATCTFDSVRAIPAAHHGFHERIRRMTRFTATAFLLVQLVFGGAAAAAAQTADEIVEKSLAAAGGRAALEKLTSRSTHGTITVSTPGGDGSGTIEVLNQAPNKSRTLITLDLSSLGAGSVVIDNRFDGTAGYSMDSMRGNRDITGSQLANLRNSYFPSPLLNYKERGTGIELKGKEKVGDRDAYSLILTPKDGPVVHIFIDGESYLADRRD